jgi:hypothetical protein
MLTRRQLLTRGTTLLVLVPVLVPVVAPILGCSSSSSDGPSCAGVDTTSSVDSSHTHTVCVLTTDLTAPSAMGAVYTTSTESMHTHKVTLTQANLTAINAGQTATVTSSVDNDPIDNSAHSHTFAIKKA